MFFGIKAGNLRLQFWQRQFVFFIITVAFMLLSFNQNSAQPRNGGCGKDCQEAKRKLAEFRNAEILKLTETLKLKPDSFDLYYQRSQIYYSIIFELSGNIYHLNADRKAYYFDVIANAIADFTKLIDLSPKTEYYLKRGGIYNYLWESELNGFFNPRYYEPQISDEKILEKISKMFLNNDNFNAAEADFLAGAKLSSDNSGSIRLFHQRLASLRIIRAHYLGRYNKYIQDLITNTKTADIIFDDINLQVEFTRKYENREWWKSTLRRNLISKAEIAGNLGRDDIALEALNEAEKLLDATKSDVCSIYSMRAKLNYENKKYDLVNKDVNLGTELDPWNCVWLFEFRGDSYRNQDNFKNAIDDYTAVIDSKRFVRSRVYRKRGKIYFQLKDYDKAIMDITNALRYSRCVIDFNFRAKIYRLVGNEKAALEDEKQESILSKAGIGNDYCSDY
jgi:tetratricopeptide (TPR) repeat protein